MNIITNFNLYHHEDLFKTNFVHLLSVMLNKYSKIVTQDSSQPAAQAMLHAIGLSEEDLKKPFVGIASTGYEGNPCNMHLNDLSKL